MLITGFGAFGKIESNPASTLAEKSGERFELLEVRYEFLERFLSDLDPDSFQTWLMIGVNARAERHQLETTARNTVCAHPDNDGVVLGPGPLDPRESPQLAATIWPPHLLLPTDDREPSVDAGGYLCNYIFFRGRQMFPDKRIGFLHVPTFETMSEERQLASLAAIVAAVQTDRRP